MNVRLYVHVKDDLDVSEVLIGSLPAADVGEVRMTDDHVVEAAERLVCKLEKHTNEVLSNGKVLRGRNNRKFIILHTCFSPLGLLYYVPTKIKKYTKKPAKFYGREYFMFYSR